MENTLTGFNVNESSSNKRPERRRRAAAMTLSRRTSRIRAPVEREVQQVQVPTSDSEQKLQTQPGPPDESQ
ncbi:hypothetical protein EYF80_041881 [Liparis tanakae]|uniref:Uncharacterized protein n=1 Tax=Liparis tanakae TaxID=230148 RepID=A0A4Z2G334_9TELE|nr:hypothetical protein EYF80_041881 [Liparis tanakae]